MSFVSSLKNFYKDFRITLSAQDNIFFKSYYKFLYRPKQGTLSNFLSNYSLYKKANFIVVQIGANDGITNDPIHKFIKRDNWRGVLLEPQPYVYNNFLKKIYKKNKGIYPLCAAIGAEDGFQKLYKIAFSNMRWATGLASFSKEKIEELFENGVVEKNCKKFGIEIPKEPEQRISYEIMEVICPQTLIKKYGIKNIDLLQIDAEGYDLEVIRLFDIKTIKPNAIVFENINHSKQILTECYEMLRENGYFLKEFGRDTLAIIHPESYPEKFWSDVKFYPTLPKILKNNI